MGPVYQAVIRGYNLSIVAAPGGMPLPSHLGPSMQGGCFPIDWEALMPPSGLFAGKKAPPQKLRRTRLANPEVPAHTIWGHQRDDQPCLIYPTYHLFGCAGHLKTPTADPATAHAAANLCAHSFPLRTVSQPDEGDRLPAACGQLVDPHPSPQHLSVLGPDLRPSTADPGAALSHCPDPGGVTIFNSIALIHSARGKPVFITAALMMLLLFCRCCCC